MQHSVSQEIRGVVAFITVMWAVFLLEFVIPNLLSFGVTPRTPRGLIGIVASPFLHADLAHLIGNTVPLFVLLVLLAGSKARSWEVVLEIMLLGGLLLWALGRPATHIGASGLAFGLIAFLIVSGWLERRLVPLMISVAVTFLYGGVLLSGVLPRFGSHISWDGHLLGALAGGLIACLLCRADKVAKTGHNHLS